MNTQHFIRRSVLEAGSPEAAGVDMSGLVRIFLRHIRLVIGTGLAVSTAVFALMASQEPLYTSTALIQVKSGQANVLPEAAIVPGAPGDYAFSAFVDSQVELLSSDALAGELTDALRLVEDEKWNKSLARSGGNLKPEAPSLVREATAKLVKERLSIKRRDLSYVVAVSAQSPRPEQAAQMANAAVEIYLNGQSRLNDRMVSGADQWLTGRLEVLKKEVAEKERAVTDFRTASGLISTGGQTLIDQQLTATEAAVVEAQTEVAEKRARASQARQMLSRQDGAESFPFALNSEVIRELRSREADIARREREMDVVLSDKHPDLIRVRSELTDIKKQIQSELSRISSSLMQEAAVAEARRNSLQNSANQIKSQLSSTSAESVQLAQLERDAAASRQVYESLLARQQEVTDQRSLRNGAADVVAEAKPSLKKSSPKLSLALLAAIGLGGFAAVCAGLAKELTEDVLNNTQDVRTKIGLPLLATVPDTKALQTGLLSGILGKSQKPLEPWAYVLAKPMSPYSESMRLVRTSLLLDSPRILALTSSIPGEGKTTTALSFARVTARSDAKVILIDCDLHLSTLSSRLAPSEAGGSLEQVLTGAKSWREAIIVDESGAHVLKNTGDHLNCSKLLRSEKMRNLLSDLKANYDLVILDCPPVLPLAETLEIAGMAESCVLISQWAKTPAGAVRSAVERLASVNITPSGIVLNRVDLRRMGRLRSEDGDYYYGRSAGKYLSA